MPRRADTQENTNTAEPMEQQVPFEATITERNVKIKEDDYGLTVTMPRTKVPHAEQYKDSVYFADKSMKQQFDQAVEKAYQENVLAPVLDQDEAEEEMEQEESAGMNMGM